jgi:hypothetical protein
MRLILGIGPGRCGTASLATLLSRQPGVTAVHTCPVRPIHPGEVPRTLDDLAALASADRPTVAAIGPQWLDIASEAISMDPQTRVVVLVRTVAAILASMDRTDYWRHISGYPWACGRDAAEYVRHYYARARLLARDCPEQMRLVEHVTPAYPDAAAELMHWLGVEAVDLRPVIENATSCCRHA